MKNIIKFAFLVLFVLGCKDKSDAQDLILNARIICAGFPTISNVDGKYLSIEISVKNNLETIKTFWINSCTWHDSFIIDDDKIEFCIKDCPSNYPIMIKISPKDSICFNTLIKVPLTAEKVFKIGLSIMNEEELKNINPSDAKSIEEARELNRKYLLNFKTCWSNSITSSSFTDPRGFNMNKYHN